MISKDDYLRHDGIGLAELVRSQQVTPAELLEAAIARAEAVNPKLNAIVRPLYERARKHAAQTLSGPFAGVPFLLKDLIGELGGEITAQGSAFFKDYRPQQDSELVRRYQAAGLVIFGKTNTPELGLTPFTEPRLYGPTRNPWNVEHTPGGSSGGSGAAVAAGIVPMANGGDGGGSIRIPASCCGLVGLKPTRGLIPTGPVRGDLWYGAATEHVLTRTVRDSAAMLDATGGLEPGAPHFLAQPAQSYLDTLRTPVRKLSIAFSSKPMLSTLSDADNNAGIQATAQLLRELGHEVVEAAPTVPQEEFIVAFSRLIAAETAADYAAASAQMGKAFNAAEVEPMTEAIRRIGCSLTALEVNLAGRSLARITREIGRWFVDYDVLLQPTLGRAPFRIGELQPKGSDAVQMWIGNHLPLGNLAKQEGRTLALGQPTFDWIPNTPVYNVTGQPSVSLPLHWSANGLPVGMMFTGRFGEDALLLQLAAQLEQARPWKDRRPSI